MATDECQKTLALVLYDEMRCNMRELNAFGSDK